MLDLYSITWQGVGIHLVLIGIFAVCGYMVGKKYDEE